MATQLTVVSADTVTNQDLDNGNFTGVLGLACKSRILGR
jgi:hypothetical protein